MPIVVTGEAGFIGNNIVFHMLNKYPDYRIICLDKLHLCRQPVYAGSYNR